MIFKNIAMKAKKYYLKLLIDFYPFLLSMFLINLFWHNFNKQSCNFHLISFKIGLFYFNPIFMLKFVVIFFWLIHLCFYFYLKLLFLSFGNVKTPLNLVVDF